MAFIKSLVSAHLKPQLFKMHIKNMSLGYMHIYIFRERDIYIDASTIKMGAQHRHKTEKTGTSYKQVIVHLTAAFCLTVEHVQVLTHKILRRLFIQYQKELFSGRSNTHLWYFLKPTQLARKHFDEVNAAVSEKVAQHLKDKTPKQLLTNTSLKIQNSSHN